MIYDAVFIGSGHASWHGALILAKAGKKVAVVERELPGGTCTNYGCNAKLALDESFCATAFKPANLRVPLEKRATLPG